MSPWLSQFLDYLQDLHFVTIPPEHVIPPLLQQPDKGGLDAEFPFKLNQALFAISPAINNIITISLRKTCPEQ